MSETAAENMVASYVELKGINKHFKDFHATKDVDISIEKGKLVALLGPSGSGKTTILRMIAGLEQPDSGEIIIDGKVVNNVPGSERGIGFVFQSYALFRYMTVYDNIAFGLRVKKVPEKDIKARVTELLSLISCEGLEKRYPSQLSGGQRQRVAFARALAPNPQILLLDEPFAAIDAKVRLELRTWLREMITRLHITSIFVEDDILELKESLGLHCVAIIPVSATEGDNVTKPSDNMKWYNGSSLLPYLENVDATARSTEAGFYLPVQRVCRPDHTFRGFQGQIESGSVAVGEEIEVLPSREKAHVKQIFVGDKEVSEAFSGQPVTIQLDKEIDISRGSVIEKNTDLHAADSVTATLIWMDDHKLENGGNYFIKLGTSLIPGVVAKILYKIDVNTGVFKETDSIEKNEIAVCKISFTDRIAVDKFINHKTLGELILIDRISFMTSACGVVEQCDIEQDSKTGRIRSKTRNSAMGQQPVTVIFEPSEGLDKNLLWEVERQLILEGRYTYFLDEENAGIEELGKIIRHLNGAGIVVLLLRSGVTKKFQGLTDEIHTIVYAGEEKDKESIVSFVKKVSSYDYDLSKEALYI